MTATHSLPPAVAPVAPTGRVVPFNRVSPAEYLALAAATTEGRLEYHDGEIVAMAGATPAHNFIVLNVGSELRSRLRGSACRVAVTDQRVFVPGKRGFLYPDIVGACGEWQYEADAPLPTLLNPVLIIEVRSASTDLYDRGRKFELYQTIPSLRYYVLLDSQRVSADLYAREPGADLWTMRHYEELSAVLLLPALGVELPLAEAYHAVVFGEGEEREELA